MTRETGHYWVHRRNTPVDHCYMGYWCGAANRWRFMGAYAGAPDSDVDRVIGHVPLPTGAVEAGARKGLP